MNQSPAIAPAPTFNDHFSDHADEYSTYRPQYPPVLFDFLARHCEHHQLVWDCATGNGQAAQGLCRYFERVVATDASESQLARAVRADNIDYRHAPAANSGLADNSVDLIVVAQALHWFELDAFYREVARVLKPGGLIAVWCYQLQQIAPDIDRVIHTLYQDLLAPYWPPERRLVETGYGDMAFPFEEMTTPPMTMTAQWTLTEQLGYLRTWSAVKACEQATGEDPVASIESALATTWGMTGSIKAVRWPLSLRLGRLRPNTPDWLAQRRVKSVP